MFRPTTLLLALALALAAPATHAQTPTTVGLGTLPGDRGSNGSAAVGISADGSIVMGQSSGPSGGESWRWTQAGGLVSLGRLSGYHALNASAMSADGSVIAGASGSVSLPAQAWRWTQAGGLVGLGNPGGLPTFAHHISGNGAVVVGDVFDGSASKNPPSRWTQAGGWVSVGIPNGYERSAFRAVSADGAVMVGEIDHLEGPRRVYEASRWTQAGGTVILGDLPGGIVNANARAVSADGTVVVGQGVSGSGSEVFRWTQAGGMMGLGDLPGGTFSSFPGENASSGNPAVVSTDGSVIVGASESANGLEAFRWTQAGGMVGLGALTPGFFNSFAQRVSADGRTVVGQSHVPIGANQGFRPETFVWRQAGGMQRLQDVLAAQGVDVAGWVFTNPTGISADGRVIVGLGTNPQGKPEAWRAVLPPAGSTITVRDVTRFGRAGTPLARVEVTVRGSVSVTDTTGADGRFSLARSVARGLDPSLPADIVLRDLASGLTRTYQALRPDAIPDTTLTLPLDLTRRLNATLKTLATSSVPDLPILRQIGDALLEYDTTAVHRLRAAWFPGIAELPAVHRGRDEHLGRLVVSTEGLVTVHASEAPLAGQVASVGVQAVTTLLAGQKAIQQVQQQIQNDASAVFASSGGQVLRAIALAVTQAGNSGLHGAYLAFNGAVESSLPSPWNTAWAFLGEAAIKGIGEGIATNRNEGGGAFLGTLIETVVEKTAGPLVDAVYIGQTQDDLDAAAGRARSLAGQGTPRSGFEASLTRANESAQRLDERLSASTAILATAKGWADFGDLTLVVGRIPGAQIAAVAGGIIRSVSFAGLAVDEVLNVRALHTAASADSPSLVALAYGLPPVAVAALERAGPTVARSGALAVEQAAAQTVVPALNRYAAHLSALAQAVPAPGRDAARIATDSLLHADADLRRAIETTQAELSALAPASAAVAASQRRLVGWTGVLAGDGLRLYAGMLPHLVPRLAEDPDGVRDAGALDGPMTGLVDTILVRIPRVRVALDSLRAAFNASQAVRVGVTAPPTLVVTDPGVGLPVAVAPGVFTVRARVMNAGSVAAGGVVVTFTADGDTTGGPPAVLRLTSSAAQALGTLAPGQAVEVTWTVAARDTSVAARGSSGVYRISTASTSAGAVVRRAVQRVAVSGQTGVGVESDGVRVPETVIEAVYPNPARRAVSVRYALASVERVRVRVYDALGREVARGVDAEQAPGRYTATVDVSALAAGVYVVRVEAGGASFTRVVTVVR